MAAPIDIPAIVGAYRTAEKRILFLDYDGTLVPFCDVPGESVMGEEVRRIITALTLDRKNTIFIISGRDRNFLSERFQGINIGLIAEHGFLVREPHGEWQEVNPAYKEWKGTALNLFNGIALQYPGAFIEEKESSVAFHYRNAGPDAAVRVPGEIQQKFVVLCQAFPELELLDGNMVSEVKPVNFNKGSTAESILKRDRFDFVMAAGDDQTDEQLFHGTGQGSFTIKVGQSHSIAMYNVLNQRMFINFLKKLFKSAYDLS
jgi:trehalose 6-phosphate synthase/phosphatase